MPFIRLAIEANEVIALKFMKIISGGPDAMAEIQLMITEKINASAEAGTSLIFGKSPTVVVARVCEHVRKQSPHYYRSPVTAPWRASIR